MHSGTVDSVFRLRHKAGKQTVSLRDRLDCKLKGHNIVGSMHRLIILEVDFMLRRSDLVMGCLNLKAHILQRQHHVTPCILAKIHRT